MDFLMKAFIKKVHPMKKRRYIHGLFNEYMDFLMKVCSFSLDALEQICGCHIFVWVIVWGLV